MWFLSVVISLVSLVLTPVVWWYLSVRKFKSLEAVPGPKTLPFLGNAHQLGKTPQELLASFTAYCEQYDNFYRFYLGSELHLALARPEHMEAILGSTVHLNKSDGYDLMKPWLGDGLLVSAGKKWKVRRKMITPTFHFKILDEFMSVFNSTSDVFVQKLAAETKQKKTDITPFINHLSLDTICETAMGVKLNTQQNQNLEYLHAVEGYLNIIIVRFFSFLERFDLHYRLFGPTYHDYLKFLKTLHAFTNGVIAKRREERKKASSFGSGYSEEGIKRRVALLDMLLDMEVPNDLSNEDIREEVDTFMFEGHDTTSSGMSFAIYALASNQEVQQRLYEEVEAVVGSEETLTMQHMQDMKYLDMFTKEAQRMYPSVPIIERRVYQDFVMDGLHVPKGTTFSLYIYGLHHSPKNYPNPEVFDPMRFSSENQSKRHPYGFLPFSAGPRNCIGQKFAMLNMKTTVVKAVKNYRFLPVPDAPEIDLGMSGVLRSYSGIWVKIERR